MELNKSQWTISRARKSEGPDDQNLAGRTRERAELINNCHAAVKPRIPSLECFYYLSPGNGLAELGIA